MNINPCINQIYSHHEDWLNIAKSYLRTANLNSDVHEDIVQEMYLKLNNYANCSKLIFPDGVINKSYIFLTLRGLCFDLVKAQKDIHKEDTKCLSKNVDDYDEQKAAFDRLCQKIDAEIETWSWYDRQLFKLYRDTPFSLRGLAKETGISWISIYNSVRNYKQAIKSKFWEDYLDYINGDYDQI